MDVNVKPNQHKIISFSTTTMTSLGFIAASSNFRSPLKFYSAPNLIFCSGTPPKKNKKIKIKIFRSPLKMGGAAATMLSLSQWFVTTETL